MTTYGYTEFDNIGWYKIYENEDAERDAVIAEIEQWDVNVTDTDVIEMESAWEDNDDYGTLIADAWLADVNLDKERIDVMAEHMKEPADCNQDPPMKRNGCLTYIENDCMPQQLMNTVRVVVSEAQFYEIMSRRCQVWEADMSGPVYLLEIRVD